MDSKEARGLGFQADDFKVSRFDIRDARVLCFRYVVDATDYENLSNSRSELLDLLSKPSLNGIPLLVLGNKIDKPGAWFKEDLTEQI